MILCLKVALNVFVKRLRVEFRCVMGHFDFSLYMYICNSSRSKSRAHARIFGTSVVRCPDSDRRKWSINVKRKKQTNPTQITVLKHVESH